MVWRGGGPAWEFLNTRGVPTCLLYVRNTEFISDQCPPCFKWPHSNSYYNMQKYFFYVHNLFSYIKHVLKKSAALVFFVN